MKLWPRLLFIGISRCYEHAGGKPNLMQYHEGDYKQEEVYEYFTTEFM